MTRLVVTVAGLVLGMVALVASPPGSSDAGLGVSQGWGGGSAYTDSPDAYADRVYKDGDALPRPFKSDGYRADGFNAEGYIDADDRWVQRPPQAYGQPRNREDESRRGGAAEPDAWGPSGASSVWGADGRSDVRTAPPPDPTYRFRGDPPSGSGGWATREGDDRYRFRPLNERESERRVQERGWRPLAPDSGSPAKRQPGQPGQGGLIDALTPPARIYGFEPNPWP